MLDKEVEEHQEGVKSTATPTVTPTAAYATNTLRLASVSSAHLTQNLTCKAANTPALASLSASVMLRELDSELQVSLHAPKEKLSGGHPYNIKCEASGVRPPPVLTWWLRGQHLTHDIHVQSLGLDSTVSELSLLATAGDDGGLLECRAAAPTLPHLTATDSTRLTVHYVPEASITIEGVGVVGVEDGVGAEDGESGEKSVGGLRADDSATLVCVARANPPAYNVTFMFNGRPLRRPNTVRSDWNLTLKYLGHKDVGLYTCVASNPEGDGESNAVALPHRLCPGVEGRSEEVLAVVGRRWRWSVVRASPQGHLHLGERHLHLQHETDQVITGTHGLWADVDGVDESR
ncbi:hemicentin-2-like isoform X1 [Homarus americanus]|uniref:hemicentin-2-like isoform X1 n=1 Tax=Homarus americanus TaxID=6706 RepID=UPI001C483182|nr:hemicentin-2-like isoform X1 [Homarus americanus]